jgi:hypothetical protein
MTVEINTILEERKKTHGDYTDHSRITQRIKAIIQDEDLGAAEIGANSKLSDDQRETLDMIAHKIGRIMAGDPNVADHWDDIAGYAKLSADRVRMRLKDKE